MTKSDSSGPDSNRMGFYSWISYAGLITIAGSLFAFVFLFVIDLFAKSANPYVGILTFLVAPMFSTLGVAMVLAGFLLRRRALKAAGEPMPLVVDLIRLREKKILTWFVVGGSFFLLVSAVGSYHSYHFTESVSFCGQACHTVMEPEFVTYQHSPHAKVACAECHIGPGAEWYVKAKLSGLYQVYATFADKYPRPIPTPIKNLRPARDTCEQCHWPEKFSGNFVRTYNHFLSDEENTEYSIRLLLKVGGGDPGRGPVSGIHWHVANAVDYLPTDESRLEIPWVRYTDDSGRVIEYRAEGFDEEVEESQVRRMDCMDCHNRPSHIYEKPNDAVDRSLAAGMMDRELPGIRGMATELLVGDYATVEEAHAQIAEGLATAYPDHTSLAPTVQEVQRIYSENFFPLMRASWISYPEHLGHKDWPGCARCHDDDHKSADGEHVISFQDCNACHLILAQGTAAELDQPSMSGQAFEHPGEELDPDFKCNDCHDGGP